MRQEPNEVSTAVTWGGAALGAHAGARATAAVPPGGRSAVYQTALNAFGLHGLVHPAP
ncbi:hypothetical protein ACFC8N_36095 [Streptomyces sp. NPDC055966]|uniref:hypothetical protein n=1 Tax=Streptomyces sp. NPDC055966 TaxID=3345669 RepID=UPI0035DE90F3